MTRGHNGMSLSLALGLMAGGAWIVTPRALAADLDEAYPSPRVPSTRPDAIAGVAGARALDPRCRVVPQPEVNLYGDTTRFRPTLICMSRGMLADSFGPYPFYYPYYSR